MLRNKPTSNLYKKPRNTKKVIAIVGLVIVLIAGTTAALQATNVINIPFLPGGDTKSENYNGINYGPPTETEKEETERFKEGLGNQSQQNQNSEPQPGQKKSFTPVIASFGQNPNTGNVEVSAYVNGIFEDGGSCTLTLTKGGQSVSASKPATPSAQNVSCGFVTIEKSRLSSGSWQATMSYTSAVAAGTSQPVTIEVQ